MNRKKKRSICLLLLTALVTLSLTGCGQKEKVTGEKVVLNGWIQKRRNLGGLIFCDLRDKTGITQIVFNDKIPQELFDRADTLRSEYVVGVKGTVME